MPVVSVVIPVFDRIDPLLRAIASVQNQTFADWEILVIDDHSSMDIAAAVAHLPVRYLKSESKGVSAARNAGIRAARGELIAFLDSDDEWVAEKLEKQIAYLRDNPTCSLVHSNETWWRNGREVRQLEKHKKSGGRIFEKCAESCVIGPSCVLARKTLFDRVGFFDESFPVCEDFDLWLRVTANQSVGFLDDALTVKHGGHGDQLSMKYHTMDLWRVRALEKHLENGDLTAQEHLALRESLNRKAAILLNGFEKYGRPEMRAEMDEWFRSQSPTTIASNLIR